MSAGTLRKWLQSAVKKTGAIAHRVPAATAALDGSASAWSPAQRLMALQESYALDDMARAGWCREHGVFEHHLARWHQEFCTSAVPVSREVSGAFRELQRQHVAGLERLEQLWRQVRASGGTPAPKPALRYRLEVRQIGQAGICYFFIVFGIRTCWARICSHQEPEGLTSGGLDLGFYTQCICPSFLRIKPPF